MEIEKIDKMEEIEYYAKSLAYEIAIQFFKEYDSENLKVEGSVIDKDELIIRLYSHLSTRVFKTKISKFEEKYFMENTLKIYETINEVLPEAITYFQKLSNKLYCNYEEFIESLLNRIKYNIMSSNIKFNYITDIIIKDDYNLEIKLVYTEFHYTSILVKISEDEFIILKNECRLLNILYEKLLEKNPQINEMTKFESYLLNNLITIITQHNNSEPSSSIHIYEAIENISIDNHVIIINCVSNFNNQKMIEPICTEIKVEDDQIEFIKYNHDKLINIINKRLTAIQYLSTSPYDLEPVSKEDSLNILDKMVKDETEKTEKFCKKIINELIQEINHNLAAYPNPELIVLRKEFKDKNINLVLANGIDYLITFKNDDEREIYNRCEKYIFDSVNQELNKGWFYYQEVLESLFKTESYVKNLENGCILRSVSYNYKKNEIVNMTETYLDGYMLDITDTTRKIILIKSYMTSLALKNAVPLSESMKNLDNMIKNELPKENEEIRKNMENGWGLAEFKEKLLDEKFEEDAKKGNDKYIVDDISISHISVNKGVDENYITLNDCSHKLLVTHILNNCVDKLMKNNSINSLNYKSYEITSNWNLDKNEVHIYFKYNDTNFNKVININEYTSFLTENDREYILSNILITYISRMNKSKK